MRFGWGAWCQFCKDYQVHIKSVYSRTHAPTFYAEARSKDELNEVVAILWRDNVTGDWVAFTDEDLPEEVEQLFDR